MPLPGSGTSEHDVTSEAQALWKVQRGARAQCMVVSIQVLVLRAAVHLCLQTFPCLRQEDTALRLRAGCSKPGGLPEMGQWERRGRGHRDRPQRGRQLGDSAGFGVPERRGLPVPMGLLKQGALPHAGPCWCLTQDPTQMNPCRSHTGVSPLTSEHWVRQGKGLALLRQQCWGSTQASELPPPHSLSA